MIESDLRNAPAGQHAGISVQPFAIADGEVVLYRRAFSASESAALFQVLSKCIDWQQHIITLYGRPVASPRLSAWYGDPGAVYSYSGLRLEPLPWISALSEIKDRIEQLTASHFNSVLLNFYRDGRDSMGWHSDDEPELGRNPVIASLSLGATRRFLLRHKKRRIQLDVELEDGSVLVMAGATQHYWRHQLPKTQHQVSPRLNLTFRLIRLLDQSAAQIDETD